MYIEVTRSMFHDQFHAYGRIDNFSYEARNVLYDHYNELEEDYGDPVRIELDVVAICCDWSELTESEIEREYGLSLDETREQTTVIEIGNGAYLVAAF